MNEEQETKPVDSNEESVEQSVQDVPQASTIESDPVAMTPQLKEIKSRRTMTKKTIFILIAVLAVIAGLAVALLLSGGEDTVTTNDSQATEQEAVTTLGATVAAIEGQVQISQDGEQWKDASGGESLANLDYLRTLDNGRAIILFDDGSVARLDSNSQLYLSSLQVDGLEITLVNGQVYSRVVESENQTFTVVTSSEQFTALGTAFKTTTTDTKDTMEVYHSGVKVKSQNLDVAEGNKYDSDTKTQSAIDLAQLDSDTFAQWNKLKDSESEEFKDKLGVLADRKAEPAPVNAGPAAGIILSATQSDKGVKLSWKLTGTSSSNGFKILRSKTDSTPSYGSNDAQYVGDGSARSTIWHDDGGGSHYYRVCIYRDGGTCDTYSNSVQATSPLIQKEPVVSGAVNLSISGNNISWTLAGGNAPHGFKVVFGTSANPTYPENSIKYTSEMSAKLPEKSAGTYYVRVCKYTNGTQDAGCVDYSNQVEYVIGE